LRILFRDELVLAIDKPAGVLTVPGRSDASAPLSAQVRELAPDALPVHRLDRDTSGVVLFALGKAAHRALSIAFEGRRAEKVYLALCSGDLAAAARCELALAPARRGGMRIAAAGEKGALPSLTELRPLERFGRYTWVEARPRTGRTHQIRVHLAALGHPLAVDPRYGEAAPLQPRALFAGEPRLPEDEPALARTPLHAAALRVPHPSGRGWLSVESPLPEDLARCLELLRAARRQVLP
jgi:RluA family pseudouridine synthase